MKSNSDLGRLQREFESARRTLKARNTTFAKADTARQEAVDAHARASRALDNGVRAIRDGDRDA